MMAGVLPNDDQPLQTLPFRLPQTNFPERNLHASAKTPDAHSCAAYLPRAACRFSVRGNAAADTPAAASYAGGNGHRVQNPFQISTLAELRLFMNSSGLFPNNAYYKHTATIDAADTSTWMVDGLPGWKPVEVSSLDAFDGQNFEIQNLFVNRPLEDGSRFLQRDRDYLLSGVEERPGSSAGRSRDTTTSEGLIGFSGLVQWSYTNSHSTATINGTQASGVWSGTR
jgi:hypothetical protein